MQDMVISITVESMYRVTLQWGLIIKLHIGTTTMNLKMLQVLRMPLSLL